MNTSTSDVPASDPFPRKVPIKEFPHQPPEGSYKPPATKQNVSFLLQANSVRVRYDEIKKRVHIDRLGQSLTMNDLVSLANLNRLGSMHFADFVNDLAMAQPVNPVRDWIKSKPWDGTDRLKPLLATIHLAEDYPRDLADTLVTRWLLSATAAACIPRGFKTRGVLTFQGPQGAGKTSWIGALVPPHLRTDFVKLDHHLDAHAKDSVLGAIGHWLVEIGELDSSFRKDIARLKGFLTNDFDKVRPPYGRVPLEMPRRSVFAGSVNDYKFLVDQTGNSRWLVLPIEKLDFDHGIDMQQLFAQLALRVEEGEQWWLTPIEEKQLEEQNDQFRAVSVIEERLKERIHPDQSRAKYKTALQVLNEIGIGSPSNAQCRECGGLLRSMFGQPHRVRGRDKWRVALTAEGWTPPLALMDPEDDDEIY